MPRYLAVIVVGVVVHPLLPASSDWVTYLAVTLLAVVAAVVGVRQNRPTDPATWSTVPLEGGERLVRTADPMVNLTVAG